MRIKISFYEAGNYTFENPENYILYDPILGKDCLSSKIVEIGNQLKEVIQEDYFNGSDNAVNYLGYNLQDEYYEFDLIPNI